MSARKRKQDKTLNECKSCNTHHLHSLFPQGKFLSFDYEQGTHSHNLKRYEMQVALAGTKAMRSISYCLHTKSEKNLRCLKKTDTGNEERKYTSGKNEVARHCVVGIGSIVAAAYYRIR